MQFIAQIIISPSYALYHFLLHLDTYDTTSEILFDMYYYYIYSCQMCVKYCTI